MQKKLPMIILALIWLTSLACGFSPQKPTATPIPDTPTLEATRTAEATSTAIPTATLTNTATAPAETEEVEKSNGLHSFVPTPDTTLEAGLSPASDGFTWKVTQEIAFLIPDGWYFRAEHVDNIFAYFASKEEIIGDAGVFYTGLSINVYTELDDPDEVAAKFYQTLINTSDGRKVLYKNAFEQYGNKVYQIRLEIKDNRVAQNDPRRPKIAYYMLVSRPEKSRFYFVVFESPKIEWDEESKKGNEILKNMVFGVD